MARVRRSGPGSTVEEVQFFEKPIELQPWLDRCGCAGDDAARVRELLGDRVDGDLVTLDRIALAAGRVRRPA